MMARYYSSSLGRFMAVDPGDDTALEDPQSWNKYAYVRNNPMRRTDPTGRMGLEGNGVRKEVESANKAGGGPHSMAHDKQVAKDLAIKGADQLGGVSTVATGVAVLAGGASLIPGPHQLATIPLAKAAAGVAVAADVANLAYKPSAETFGAVILDVVGGQGAKAVGGMLAKESKAFSQPVGEVLGEAILGVATMAAPAFAEALGGPISATPQRPLVMDVPLNERRPVVTTPPR